MSNRRKVTAGAAALGSTLLIAGGFQASAAATAPAARPKPAALIGTTTPIKHLVVIFQENVSFDHYFGTYPKAANTSGQPFKAAKAHPEGQRPGQHQGRRRPRQPADQQPEQGRLAATRSTPRRLDPANLNDVLTCDQDHDYADEQKAFDGGAMDKFVTTVGTGVGHQRHRPALQRRATS